MLSFQRILTLQIIHLKSEVIPIYHLLYSVHTTGGQKEAELNRVMHCLFYSKINAYNSHKCYNEEGKKCIFTNHTHGLFISQTYANNLYGFVLIILKACTE